MTLVIGPDDAANNQVTIKDLASGSQQTVAQPEVVAAVRKILESHAGG